VESIKFLRLALVGLLLLACFSPLLSVKAQSYSYTFYGPYDEYYGYDWHYLGNRWVQIIAHFENQSSLIATLGFNTTLSYTYTPATQPLYFSYLVLYEISPMVGAYERQYWLSADETTGEYTIYAIADTQYTEYTINFLDYVSLLTDYPYVEAQLLMNDTYNIVERIPVDSTNTVVMTLQQGIHYRLVLGDGTTEFIFGDFAPSSVTSVQLTLKGADFPKETLLMYPYVTFYGVRAFATPYGSIAIYYNDTKAMTTSFTATITETDGTIVDTYSTVANTVNYNWTSAVNATIYIVTVEVEHSEYGDVSWTQTFANQAGDNAALFSLGFLGSWFFDTGFLLPALIVLLVAACFSALNAEVGAVLTCIAALALSYMGWLPIGAGSMVAAFSFAILMALLYNRRRVVLY
jgi:hypothetical protein